MNVLIKILTTLVVFAIVFSSSIFANAGDQRVVENKYLINLSRAPFTPKVGIETSNKPLIIGSLAGIVIAFMVGLLIGRKIQTA